MEGVVVIGAGLSSLAARQALESLVGEARDGIGGARGGKG
jgi:hypothetical protein